MGTSGFSRYSIRSLSALVAIVGIISVLPLAQADLPETILTIVAQTQDGRSTGSVVITQEDGYWDGEDFFWQGEDIPIYDQDDNLIATLSNGVVEFYADPQVSIGFAVQAEDQDTNFVITSALLTFPTIQNGLARADAAFTVQDFLGTGATLTGTHANGGAYLAQYNGFVPGGTTFLEAIESIEVVPPDTLATAEVESPGGGLFTPIGTVSDMSAEIAFELTAYGLASGSSNFVIIPEPTSLLLLAAGALWLRRR